MKNYTNWSYQVIEETLEDQLLGKYHTYGIKINQKTVCGWEEIKLVHDISLKADFVQRLALLFNQHQLFPIHIGDVLNDLLP